MTDAIAVLDAARWQLRNHKHARHDFKANWSALNEFENFLIAILF